MVLRPAWRNYWVHVLAVLAGAVAAPGLWIGAHVDRALPVQGISQYGQVGAQVVAALTLVLLLALLYRRFSWKYAVDGHRISRQHGIIARNYQSVRTQDLRSVEVKQTVLQRIFKLGDIAFYSAGTADAEVTFQGISSPMRLRDHIRRLTDEARSRGE